MDNEFVRTVLQADNAERRREGAEDGLTRWRRRAAERAEDIEPPPVVTSEPIYNALRSSTSHDEAWNAWLRSSLDQEFDQHIMPAMEALAQEAGHTVGKVERQARDATAKLRDEIHQLRIAVAELRGELRGRAAAEVIDLPRMVLRQNGVAKN